MEGKANDNEWNEKPKQCQENHSDFSAVANTIGGIVKIEMGGKMDESGNEKGGKENHMQFGTFPFTNNTQTEQENLICESAYQENELEIMFC